VFVDRVLPAGVQILIFPLIMRWAIGQFSLSGQQEGWRRVDLRERQDRFAVGEAGMVYRAAFVWK
jgi:hypothetical protein